jgi:hypothetical protein
VWVLSITSPEALPDPGLQKAMLLFQRHTLLIYWKIIPSMTNVSSMCGTSFQIYRIKPEYLSSYVNLVSDFVGLSPGRRLPLHAIVRDTFCTCGMG